MAKPDGQYWFEIILPEEKSFGLLHTFQIVLNPGLNVGLPGSATLTYWGGLSKGSSTHNNPDGTQSQRPAVGIGVTAVPNITLQLTGLAQIQALANSPVPIVNHLLVDNAAKLTGLNSLYLSVVLATGGANDGDIQFFGPSSPNPNQYWRGGHIVWNR